MREVIRQLIDAERDAGVIEDQAAREAEAILARGREAAAALADTLRAEGRHRGSDRVAAAIRAAEAEKAAALTRIVEPLPVGTGLEPGLREALITAVAGSLAGRP